MGEEKKDPEYALSMANIAMSEAVRGHDRITALEVELKRTTQDALIARSLCNDLENGHNTAMTAHGATMAMISNQAFKIKELEEGHHDLNMALSETNERLETLELMMQLQTTAPLAAATDAEAELVDQLITAESSLEAANNALDAALQLIHDIRKRARELGTMNTDEWTDLGQRSVAILELHKLI